MKIKIKNNQSIITNETTIRFLYMLTSYGVPKFHKKFEIESFLNFFIFVHYFSSGWNIFYNSKFDWINITIEICCSLEKSLYCCFIYSANRIKWFLLKTSTWPNYFGEKAFGITRFQFYEILIYVPCDVEIKSSSLLPSITLCQGFSNIW